MTTGPDFTEADVEAAKRAIHECFNNDETRGSYLARAALAAVVPQVVARKDAEIEQLRLALHGRDIDLNALGAERAAVEAVLDRFEHGDRAVQESAHSGRVAHFKRKGGSDPGEFVYEPSWPLPDLRAALSVDPAAHDTEAGT